jgi:hypothetical protein
LPDGIFSYQKSQFWYTLVGLGVENFDIVYGHLVFLHIAVWFILWSVCRYVLYIFHAFYHVVPKIATLRYTELKWLKLCIRHIVLNQAYVHLCVDSGNEN